MRVILLCLVLGFSLQVLAQTPQAFKYQAVARDTEGNPLVNQDVSLKVSILSGSPDGTMVYSELHETMTNELGLFSLEIGNPGLVLSGTFTGINWADGTYFLKLEIDPAGGLSFQLMGISQLLSVPYALYADKVAHNDDADADPTNELQQVTKEGNVVTLSRDGGSFTDENTTYQAGDGLSLNGTTFTNSAPDQVVNIFGGNGISRSGTYPSFTITNTKPDQTVILQGTGAATVSGTYPNFTVNSNPNDTSAVNEIQVLNKVGSTVSLSKSGGSFVDDNTTYSAGSGLQLTGTTFSNTAPDQTVSISAGTGITRSGTYPNFTISNSAPDQMVSITAGDGITKSGNYPNFIITNNMPDQSVTMQGTGDATVSGTYPNFTINSDPSNELQTLTQNGYQVTLSQGGGTIITGVKSYSQSEINALTPYNGLTVHNTTTNCINYYFINNWYEACGTCVPQPTTPNAGADQIDIGGNTTTLAANTPVYGTGLWTIVSGEGGSLGDPTSPTSTFTGIPSRNYVLAWTISNPCASLTDNVNIRFLWSCGMTIIDERDAKSYNTVQIGTQCWMKQNLNIGTRITSTTNQTNNGTIEKYCYNNSDTQCDVYGGLYQWEEMMQYSTTQGVKGICPNGWHLPSDAESTNLTNYVSNQSTYLCNSNSTFIAKSMASTTGWSTAGITCAVGNNQASNNACGFTGLPGGYRQADGSFNLKTYTGCWWIAVEFGTSISWFRGIDYSSATVSRDIYSKAYGLSVRCLKD